MIVILYATSRSVQKRTDDVYPEIPRQVVNTLYRLPYSTESDEGRSASPGMILGSNCRGV